MLKIQLIDDEENGREALSRRLLRKGCKVMLSSEGDEGFEQAVADVPDLIVIGMSLVLPDGWEVTRRLKSDPRTAGVPVVALLEEDTQDQREKAIDAGCDDYLAKPLHIEKAVEHLMRLLESRRNN